MLVTAFDEDRDERGERDDLVAHGIVQPSLVGSNVVDRGRICA
jgi:hypothetical protein